MNVRLSAEQTHRRYTMVGNEIKILNSTDVYGIMQQILMRENKI